MLCGKRIHKYRVAMRISILFLLQLKAGGTIVEDDDESEDESEDED